MIISVKDFAGMMPILSPYRIANNMAQEAINCDFINGDLEPIHKPGGSAGHVPYGTKYIFRYEGRWITSTEEMDVALSTITNDEWNRVYRTLAGNIPEMSHSGSSSWFTLGVEAPIHGPTLTDEHTLKSGVITKILSTTEFDSDPNQTCDTSSGEGCGTKGVGPLVCFSNNHKLETGTRVKIGMALGMTFLDGRIYSVIKIDDNHFSLSGASPTEGFPFEAEGAWTEYRDESEKETRGYCYTYVTGIGEEGPPSPISTVEVYGDSAVMLTDVIGDAGNDHPLANQARKRIYRSVTSATGTQLHFIGDIVGYGTEFLDDIDPAAIGEPIPSESWDMPPADMRGLISMPNGIMAGFYKRDICFSVPFMPHAWPIEYRLNVESDIVAMAVFGQSMVVATKEKPYIVTGTDPSSMTLEKMEINQACVSKGGMVDMGESVIYPSPDGLIEIRRGAVTNLTKNVFSREQWTALKPETMRAFNYEGTFAFSTWEGSYLYSQASPTLTKVDVLFTGGFTDIETDTFYIVDGNNIVPFDGKTERDTYEWISKIFKTERPVNFSCMQICMEANNLIEFTLYCDGTALPQMDLEFDSDRTLSKIYRLPEFDMASEFKFKLSGKGKIREIAISTSVQELRDI